MHVQLQQPSVLHKYSKMWEVTANTLIVFVKYNKDECALEKEAQTDASVHPHSLKLFMVMTCD